MPETPPPSPTTLFKAQLVVKKAALAKKADKAKKEPAKKDPAKPKKAAQKKQAETDDADKENAEEDGSDGISWAKNPKDTSRLLTIIEDNLRYRQAFGFKGGDVPGVTSGGLTIAQISRDIGQEIFPASSLPVTKLGTSIKNRVQSLKKNYSEYHKKLGQTGHGLVMEDRTTEIVPGTPISNVWDKMQARFPWYKRLHLLLNSSPVYDGSALANSTTPLDVGVLGTRTTNAVTSAAARRSPSVEWDYKAMDASFESFDDDKEADEKKSRSSSPILVGSQSTPPDTGVAPAAAIATTPSITPAEPATPRNGSTTADPPQSQGRKRKDPFEQVRELSAAYHGARMDADRAHAESKRQRVLIKAENRLALERLKAEEHERQRKHEREMMDKQILLARLQAGSYYPMNPNAAAGPSRTSMQAFPSTNCRENGQDLDLDVGAKGQGSDFTGIYDFKF